MSPHFYAVVDHIDRIAQAVNEDDEGHSPLLLLPYLILCLLVLVVLYGFDRAKALRRTVLPKLPKAIVRSDK